MALFSAGNTTRGTVQRAARDAEPWIERLARLGYSARGLVYLTVGGLALQLALRSGGRTTGSEGALRTFLQQPFGRVLLAAVAVGMVGYALWRFVQASLDPEGSGSGAKGAVKRAAYFLSGLIHAGLALEAVRLLTGTATGGSDDNEGARHWTRMLLEQPLGRWLVALVGLGVVGFGAYELIKAYRVDFSKRLDLAKLGADGRRWVIRFGRLGLAARGVVFGMLGTFLIQAAWSYDSSEARGLGGVLESLHSQAHGRWLLGLVAAGLIAYGVLEFVKARFRRIDPA